MSENTQDTAANSADPFGAAAGDKAATDLARLKEQADLMGIVYSNNIGEDTLRRKINEHMEALEKDNVAKIASTPVPEPVDPLADLDPHTRTAIELDRDYTHKIRVVVEVNDPDKKTLMGEFITISNRYIGTVREFVPYGDEGGKGWHLPLIIVEHLETHRYLHKRNGTQEINGAKVPKVHTSWQPAYNVRRLPAYTAEELAALAQAQLATGRVG